jgi:hypothetical protein
VYHVDRGGEELGEMTRIMEGNESLEEITAVGKREPREKRK